MTKTLKSIAPLQLGKVFGAVYGLLTLLFIPFIILFAVIAAVAPAQQASAPPALLVIAVGLAIAVIMPIFYAVAGFVFGALGALAYNLIATWVGGIQVEVE